MTAQRHGSILECLLFCVARSCMPPGKLCRDWGLTVHVQSAGRAPPGALSAGGEAADLGSRAANAHARPFQNSAARDTSLKFSSILAQRGWWLQSATARASCTPLLAPRRDMAARDLA